MNVCVLGFYEVLLYMQNMNTSTAGVFAKEWYCGAMRLCIQVDLTVKVRWLCMWGVRLGRSAITVKRTFEFECLLVFAPFAEPTIRYLPCAIEWNLLSRSKMVYKPVISFHTCRFTRWVERSELEVRQKIGDAAISLRLFVKDNAPRVTSHSITAKSWRVRVRRDQDWIHHCWFISKKLKKCLIK